MNGRWLLDTNVLIDYMSGKEAAVRFFDKKSDLWFFISVISRIELLSYLGITPQEEKEAHEVFASAYFVPLNGEVEDLAIRFRRATRRKLPDALVAASAIFIGATLVTSDKELAGADYPGLQTIMP
jgi:predicted nucleic acid-binding protein